MAVNDPYVRLTADIILEQTPEHTDAKVALTIRDLEFGGWGRARRNPADPDVPKVGEELAIARALDDLAHRLLDAAARSIEEWEGGPVELPR